MRTRRAFSIQCSSTCRVHCRICSRSNSHTSPQPHPPFPGIAYTVLGSGFQVGRGRSFFYPFDFVLFQGETPHMSLCHGTPAKPPPLSLGEAHPAWGTLPFFPTPYPCSTHQTKKPQKHSHLLCSLEPQAGHCREPGSPSLPPPLNCAKLEFCCAKVPAGCIEFFQ